ncbi:MAG: hypothetical protein KA242_01260 [Chitinophagales bacterium]|nr:hypothetical protein [Chitinophagales bacterium]
MKNNTPNSKANALLNLKMLLFLVCFGLYLTPSFAQFGASPWIAPNGTYTVPAGVTSITVTCYGGGGAGGGARSTDRNGGGGGGGACVTVSSFPVSPGNQITVSVGAGGTGVSQASGNPGLASSVSIGSTVFARAAGGAGGAMGANSSSAGAGGAGGLKANNIPVNVGNNGGNGAGSNPTTTSTDQSGGGGGGAGTAANGGNGVTGGAGGGGGATGGGAGGTGRSTTSNSGSLGGSGTGYGGGGGGSTVFNTGTRPGGNGAAGAVIITYGPCTPSTAPTSITGPSTVCPGVSTTLTSAGGTLGTGDVDVWYEGGCGVEAYSQDWQSQPHGGLQQTTVNSVNGVLNVTSAASGNDPFITMYNPSYLGSFDPNTYKYINVRYKVNAGTAGNCEIFFTNSTFTAATGIQDYAAGALISDGQWHILSIDMAAANAAANGIPLANNYWNGTNASGNITGWRFDWATGNNVNMDIDFVTLTDRPVLESGPSYTFISPAVSKTYYTARRGACAVTACASQLLTISCLPPDITSIPSSACPGSTIAISGTDLGSAAITVNGLSVTSILSNTGTQIQFIVPPSASGTTGNIVVSTPGGSDSLGTITINPLPTISTSALPASAAVCSGVGVQLSASGTSASYAWSPATGLSATSGANVTATPSSGTTYTVTGTLNGCTASASIPVTIGPVVAVSVVANPAFVCAGASTTLSAVYQPLPANDLTNGLGTWTTQNLSSGGCPGPAPAAWTVRPSNYNYVYTVPIIGATETHIMNFGAGAGDYILSNAQAQYEGLCFSTPTTDTRFTSPAFSTVSFTGVTLNFSHVFRFGDSVYSASNNEAFVEVSTNGGSNWTTLQGYGQGYQNIGTASTTGFLSTTTTYTGVAASINLNAYAGLPSVMIRFRYRTVGGNDGKWALDNINVVGAPAPVLTYNWTSSPAGFTSTAASPTPTVNQTTIYSLVASSGGCSSPPTPVTVTVLGSSAAPGAISGPTAVCAGSSYVYSIAAIGGASTYTWSVPSGWNITAGAGTTSITVTTNNNSGNVSVTQTNCTGVSLPSVLAVTSTTLPSISFSPASPSICLGGTGTVVTASSTATAYTWTPSSGLSSTNVANPTANPTATTTYSVVGTLNGCPSPPTTVTVSVNQNPSAVTASASPTSVCAGSNVNLSSTASTVTKTLFQENFETANAAQTKLSTTAYIGWKDATISGTNNFFWVFDATRCGVLGGSYSLAVSQTTPATSGTMPAWANAAANHVAYYATPIDATGYTQLKLNFKWRASGNSASNGKVCYSLNGTTWTDFPTTGTYRGQATTQTVTNLDISAMNGQAFYLGFRSTTANNFLLGNAAPAFTVDDISITGLTSSTISYAWSSSPAGFTASTQNATANPNQNTTYTVVASDNTGCSVSSSVAVNTTARPTATWSGPSTLCPNVSDSLFIQFTGTAPYNFTYTVGGSTFNVTGFNTSTFGLPVTLLSTTSFEVTALSDANCIAQSADLGGVKTITVPSSCSLTWVGGTSTDWGNASNWSPSIVPNACAIDVTIPAGTPNAPTISGSNYSVGNVSIASGVNLTLSGNNLSVCGNWNAGTGADAVTIGTGNIVFQGGTAHAISGNTTFNKVTLNDAAGASLAAGATVDITDRLNLQTGTFTTNAGVLTFKSASASQCATIDHFTAGYNGTIVGAIYAERYVPVGGSNQHYISSPIDNLSLTQFGASGASGFVIPTTNCDETQLQAGSPYGTVFQFHEDQAGVCALKGWEVKAGGTADNARGYSAYLTGLTQLTVNGSAQLANSVAVSGLSNTGWSNHTTLQGRLQSSGWNLIGNPYLANLDLSTHAGFDNQVQVWVTSGPYAGTYQASLMGSSATIAPFQGFMVHKTAVGSTSFTIAKSECSNNPQQFFKTNDSELEVVLSGNGFNDKTTVLFNTDATPAFDPAFDANKIHSKLGQPTLYTLESSNAHLAINTYPSVAQTVAVPLSLEPGKNGQYSLSFDKINTFDPTQFIFLEDKKTGGAWVNVRSQPNYTFQALTTDNWDRFVLHFTPALSVVTEDAVCDQNGTIALSQLGTADWTFVVDDAKGSTVSSGNVNANKAASMALPAGVYTLTLTDKSGYTTTKTVQVNGTTVPVNADFTVPSLIDAGVAVQLTDASNNTTASVSYTWNFGDGTSIVGVTNPVHTFVNAGTYAVVLTITTPEGCKATISKTITVRSKTATGIDATVESSDLNIYAVKDKVFVNFEKTKDNVANIKIYSIIGQELSNEMYLGNGIYTKNLNLEAAFVVVIVKQKNAKPVTKKVFITNQ